MAGESAAQRHTLRVLVAAQICSGAGLAAGVTVGALLAEDMLGSTSLAGIPAALLTGGSAAAALTIGRISDRFGRRPGLALGYAAGATGSVGVVTAAALDSVLLLFLALVVYGAGSATNLQARYAGADLAGESRRGRAVSTVLFATTLGAVLGPNLVDVMGGLAEDLDIPRLAGPFILAAAAYGTAAAVLFTRLRPDPLLLARSLEPAGVDDTAEHATVGPSAAEHSAAEAGAEADGVDKPAIERRQPTSDGPRRPAPSVAVGASVMVVTQLVMVAIMTMTPVHMKDHGHSVGAAGMVIAAHIAGMYLPSPISGVLVDRYGGRVLAVASGVTLLVAGVLAASVSDQSVLAIAVALTVLGLGWNLGLVAGTAILTAAVPLAVRARTQGAVDLCIALAGAGGGLGSGLVVSAGSFSTLGLVGAGLALAIIPVVTLSAGGAARPSGPAPSSNVAEALEEPAATI